MNTSIPEPESPVAISSASIAREAQPLKPRAPEPTLARLPQEDPNGPPLFELRAEYMIDPGGAPSRLCGAVGRFVSGAGDLLLSAVYFLGLGALAPLARSRDPLSLAGKRSARWLVLSTTRGRDHGDSRR